VYEKRRHGKGHVRVMMWPGEQLLNKLLLRNCVVGVEMKATCNAHHYTAKLYRNYWEPVTVRMQADQ